MLAAAADGEVFPLCSHEFLIHYPCRQWEKCVLQTLQSQKLKPHGNGGGGPSNNAEFRHAGARSQTPKSPWSRRWHLLLPSPTPLLSCTPSQSQDHAGAPDQDISPTHRHVYFASTQLTHLSMVGACCYGKAVCFPRSLLILCTSGLPPTSNA